MGRGWSRLFVIGLFLAIVGLAAAQSYYLLSIAESSEVAADTTEAVGAPADTTAAP
jgi:hypothetical protein